MITSKMEPAASGYAMQLVGARLAASFVLSLLRDGSVEEAAKVLEQQVGVYTRALANVPGWVEDDEAAEINHPASMA